jgi:pimeloyl-ACP methyl ester carboxylesterase
VERVLKRLGVSMVVIVAALSMAAPAAASKAFMAGEYTAEVSGQQSGEHVFTAEAGITVKCKAATLKGELAEAKTEVELAPTYGECTASGVAATVVTEGCKYRLDANANDIDVVCESGKKITVTAGTCELQIGSQNGLKSIEYANSAALPSTITGTASITKIKYTKTKDGIFCPFNGTGEKEDGGLTGQTVAKALKGSQIDLFVAPECSEEWVWVEESCEAWETEEEWEPPAEEEQWPEEEVPAEEEEEAGINPILFVHGYRGGLGTFETMVARFIVDGWPAAWLHNWAYDWEESNVDIAKEISTRVNTLLKVTGAKKVDIVTHSMGGLSSRYYLKNLGGTAKVDEWVSLGGPNHGTTTARLCSAWSTSCQQMRRGSAFLESLNEGDETPGEVRYGTWRSNGDWVILPEESVVLSGAEKNLQWLDVSHGGLHEKLGIYEEVRKFVEG